MTDTEMTGAEIILEALKEHGVDTVFGYPGGAVLPLYDALFKQNHIRHVLVRQEGGALHAAEGYARSTGKVGVALVTSGPGSTNAVTGIMDAHLDSVPIICLCGQVPTTLIGNDAFQEADTTGITRPCSKHNYLVKETEDLARTMHEAFHVATTGRPGPVVVDLPKNVQAAMGQYISKKKVKHKSYNPVTKADTVPLELAVEMMAQARKPIFYAGGGLVNSEQFGDYGKATELFTEFVRMTGFPTTLTLMGLGAYPASDKQFLGMLGMHGTYEANMAMHGCDLMICIGARFDDRITGNLDSFSPHSKKIHIDIDPSSINKNVPVHLPIIGDAADALEKMIAIWKEKNVQPDKAAMKKWWAQIDGWRARKSLAFKQEGEHIKPQHAIRRLCEMTKDKNPYITTEVGQHQMWTAQYFDFEAPFHWMTSGGLGTMGYGLPAAVGAQVAHPDNLVVCIAGDSSIQMNIQELATAVQDDLPLKILLLNNGFMGMVRQWQELIYGKRYSQSRMDVAPDMVRIAEAYGVTGMRVTDPAELDEALQKMLDTPGPVLLDVHVDPEANCYPMIPAGEPHNFMLLGPDEDDDTSSDAVIV